jgi:hypothetical protein
MDKVKITQELANAIEKVRAIGMYDNRTFEILEMATKSPKDDDIMLKEHEIIYKSCIGDGIDILIEALVNGYEVEETPEDKVRELYEYLGQESIHYASKDIQNKIQIMLNLLNIKIVGVNHE